MAVEFRLLGEVEAVVNGDRVDLGHIRQRCVLAVLLVDANRAVPADRILERVWGERPPQRAAGVLRTYLSRLRRTLVTAPDVGIVHRPDGYAVTVEPEAVRAVLSASCRALTPDAARLFGLMGLCPGPDLALPAAASLAALPPARVAGLLRELIAGHLVQASAAGRYRMHDLVRLFAAEQVPVDRAAAGDANERASALRRILDHYVHTAGVADHLLAPHRDPITLAAPLPGVAPERLPDHSAALAWFTAEHAGLRAALDCAADIGLDTHVWQLAWGLTTFFDRCGHWQDRLAVHAAALAAARRRTDAWAQAHAHREMALAYVWLGRHDEAHTHLEHALGLFSGLGCLTGQAHTQRSLARVHARQGRHREALPHDRKAVRALGTGSHGEREPSPDRPHRRGDTGRS